MERKKKKKTLELCMETFPPFHTVHAFCIQVLTGWDLAALRAELQGLVDCRCVWMRAFLLALGAGKPKAHLLAVGVNLLPSLRCASVTKSHTLRPVALSGHNERH